MKTHTPTIQFQSSSNSESIFEIVTLHEVLKKTPKDHKQTENHNLAFYVLFIITEGLGVHTIDYKDYSYKKGTVFNYYCGQFNSF